MTCSSPSYSLAKGKFIFTTTVEFHYILFLMQQTEREAVWRRAETEQRGRVVGVGGGGTVASTALPHAAGIQDLEGDPCKVRASIHAYHFPFFSLQERRNHWKNVKF